MGTELVGMAAALVVALLAVLLQVLSSRTDRLARARIFDAVRDQLTDGRVSDPGGRYPVLTGALDGHPVRLSVVVDSLAPRTLPSLLLVLTQRRALALVEPLDAQADPTGTELLAAGHEFGHVLPTPAGLPVPVRITTPNPGAAGPALLEQLTGPLRLPGVTSVHVGPAGVRITYRLTRGAIGPYRTTRQADFGPIRISPTELASPLRALAELGDALAAPRAAS